MSLLASADKKTSYRLILLGKTGSGKSATGNSILGSQAFCSKESVDSVTQDIPVCKSVALDGNTIVVVDTPGIFDTNKPVIQTALTIQNSFMLVSPGPHIFLIVMKPSKFVEEDERTLEILTIMFGAKFMDHSIIIFTHFDQIKDFGQLLHQSEENEKIKRLLDKCGRRIITINNQEKDTEIIQRKRKTIMLMVSELSDNGGRFYQDDISIYSRSLIKHANEWTDTRWDCSKIQTILQEQEEEVMRMERERQLPKIKCKRQDEIVRLERTMNEKIKRVEETTRKREMSDRLGRESLVIKHNEAELKINIEREKGKAFSNGGNKFVHDAYQEDKPSLLSVHTQPMDSHGNLKGGGLEDKGNDKDHDKGPDRSEDSGLGSLEEMTEPVADGQDLRIADTDRETRMGFEDNLNELISHLQSCMQRKLQEKRIECIARWKERVFPQSIIQALKGINNGRKDRKWEESLQKAKATVEVIEKFQENEIPDKQELLIYIYTYFIPTFAEVDDFTRGIGHHENDWIIVMEKFLKTLPEEKYPYEAALLNFEIMLHYTATWETFEKRDSFKSRALSAARKAKDQELQLYGTVLFILVEWMDSCTYIGPGKSQPFDPEIEHTEEMESSAPRLNGSSSHPFDVPSAISREDLCNVHQYLENRAWKHDNELFNCPDYSPAFDSNGNHTMTKVTLSLICKELAKLHQLYKVSVWAASIAREYSSSDHTVLVCNYWDDVDEKFRDNCFLGHPVIYQEYNTVNEEELCLQSSETFMEAALSPIDATWVNTIISLNSDRLMKNHSNLEVIKPCAVRSVRLEVKRETCIVLYCRMKGFVPFGETLFPKTLSAGEISFPVDVREGYYVPAMFQENSDVRVEGPWDPQLFRMGFSIGPYEKEISATVGPFVQLEGNNVGFLTCAHAFGVPCNISSALREAIVQPAKGEYASVNPVPADESICGYVERITFDIHPDKLVTVDAALIRLKPEKVPKIGRFAWMNPRSLKAAGLKTGESLIFDHGEIISKETLKQVPNHGKIIKFGAASGVTTSNILDGGCVVIRGKAVELFHEHGEMFPPISEGTRSYIMKGQYLIRSRQNNVFLVPGDSGSGVFYMDEEKRLRCIGIAVGFLANTNEAVVTHIEDVLEALGLHENALMRFAVH